MSGMINVAFSRPAIANNKLDETYLRNFNLALLNWELNRQEDRKSAIVRKARRALK